MIAVPWPGFQKCRLPPASPEGTSGKSSQRNALLCKTLCPKLCSGSSQVLAQQLFGCECPGFGLSGWQQTWSLLPGTPLRVRPCCGTEAVEAFGMEEACFCLQPFPQPLHSVPQGAELDFMLAAQAWLEATAQAPVRCWWGMHLGSPLNFLGRRSRFAAFPQSSSAVLNHSNYHGLIKTSELPFLKLLPLLVSAQGQTSPLS